MEKITPPLGLAGVTAYAIADECLFKSQKRNLKRQSVLEFLMG